MGIADTNLISARHWILTGRVQGVGFRPFVFNLATEIGLSGWVKNSSGIVEILAQGQNKLLDSFQQKLINHAPDFAQPVIQNSSIVEFNSQLNRFEVRTSDTKSESCIHIPPDLFVCDDCLEELNNPHDRRYRYPFINCTQCGPRYTLIKKMPYDRPNTTMVTFKLCEKCRAEYTDPHNRRFHAEPVACPDCGPALAFKGQGGDVVRGNDKALHVCLDYLHAGKVIAVRGVGGYHLMCDARSDEAVKFLRKNKPRPDKPLAVMFPSSIEAPLKEINRYVNLSIAEGERLLSAARPIVLAQKQNPSTLSELIAPGLNEFGVMLPYSPLHHLLLNDFDGPLVATSANIAGEPVLTEPAEVESRLSHCVHGWLHHNRPIHRPIDDAVYHQISGKTRPIRLGRGIAPVEIELPFEFPAPTLAVGGQMKNTIALGWGSRLVISPHIGEMTSARSFRLFESMIKELQTLYDVRVEKVIHDAHPGYATTRWANSCGLPTFQVFHHHAHASAACDLNTLDQNTLAFTWDGVGFGEDGRLWGGETFFGRPGNWQRVATFRPFRLPGGDRVSREPWRSAASLCWEIGHEFYHSGSELLKQAWERRINSPESSAAGRIFDAAAAMTGICEVASFEGEGPMYLESLVSEDVEGLELPVKRKSSGILEADWEPLVPALLNPEKSVGSRANVFHSTMATLILEKTLEMNKRHEFAQVTLSGGVFQNRMLTEQAVRRLEQAGFSVFLTDSIPVNDAGLSYGQLIEYSLTM